MRRVRSKSRDHSSLLSITLLLCYPTLSIAIKIKSKRNEIVCCIKIRWCHPVKSIFNLSTREIFSFDFFEYLRNGKVLGWFYQFWSFWRPLSTVRLHYVPIWWVVAPTAKRKLIIINKRGAVLGVSMASRAWLFQYTLWTLYTVSDQLSGLWRCRHFIVANSVDSKHCFISLKNWKLKYATISACGLAFDHLMHQLIHARMHHDLYMICLILLLNFICWIIYLYLM